MAREISHGANNSSSATRDWIENAEASHSLMLAGLGCIKQQEHGAELWMLPLLGTTTSKVWSVKPMSMRIACAQGVRVWNILVTRLPVPLTDMIISSKKPDRLIFEAREQMCQQWKNRLCSAPCASRWREYRPGAWALQNTCWLRRSTGYVWAVHVPGCMCVCTPYMHGHA